MNIKSKIRNYTVIGYTKLGLGIQKLYFQHKRYVFSDISCELRNNVIPMIIFENNPENNE